VRAATVAVAWRGPASRYCLQIRHDHDRKARKDCVPWPGLLIGTCVQIMCVVAVAHIGDCHGLEMNWHDCSAQRRL
jgi:hypothetical protein